MVQKFMPSKLIQAPGTAFAGRRVAVALREYLFLLFMNI
jgi:hypothetical protein